MWMKMLVGILGILFLLIQAAGMAANNSREESGQRPGVVLEFEKETYRKGDSIILTLWLENKSNAPRSTRSGFALTPAKFSIKFEVTFPDGTVWTTCMGEADPEKNFMVNEPIRVGPNSRIKLGVFDLGSMHLIPGDKASLDPSGYKEFWKIAGRGAYSVCWWDGVFQLGKPLYSNDVRFKIE